MPGLVQSTHLPAFHDVAKDDDRFTCIFALRRQGFRRCLNPINKGDRSQAARLRKEIVQCRDSDLRDELLRQYARLCCCVHYHRVEMTYDESLVEQISKRWGGEIDSQRVEEEDIAADPAQPTRRIEPRPSLLEQPAVAIEVVETPLRLRVAPYTAPTTRSVSSQSASVARRSCEGPLPSRAESPAPHFIPYATRPDLSLSQGVQRPLLRSEYQTGTVYLFTRESDPGFVKIGFTAGLASGRLQQWQRSCLYSPRLEYEFRNFPHARRVELLVQKELWQQRRREPRCRHNIACYTKHMEWFEADVKTASAVIERWARWMEEGQPYDAEGNLTREWKGVCQRLEKDGRVVDSVAMLEAMSEMQQRRTRDRVVQRGIVAERDILLDVDDARIERNNQDDRREDEVKAPDEQPTDEQRAIDRSLGDSSTSAYQPDKDPRLLELLSSLSMALMQMQSSIRMLSAESDPRVIEGIQRQLAPVVRSSLALGEYNVGDDQLRAIERGVNVSA